MRAKNHFNTWFQTLIFILLMVGAALCAHAQLTFPSTRLGLPSTSSDSHIFQTPHVKAELLVYTPQGIQHGETVWFGVLLQHEPQWHTYWVNPGDIGLPTKLSWTVPEGIQVAQVQWPEPQLIRVDEQVLNYGYEGSVLLPVPVDVSKTFNSTELTIELDISWLTCKIECIPESGHLSLTVPTQQTLASSAAVFENALQQLPQKDNQVTTSLQIKDDPTPGILIWKVSNLPSSMQGKALQLLPEDEGIMTTAGPLFAEWQQNTWTAAYALKDFRLEEPQTMRALLRVADTSPSLDASSELRALIINAHVEGAWPAQTPLSDASEDFIAKTQADRSEAENTAQQSGVGGANKVSFWSALLLAFLGGLLLNLMPCVFPVLSIKALTFAQAGGSRHAHRLSGLAYGLGVMVTMLILACIFLMLRAASSGLGWGFQLQSPVFVTLLAVLFTLIALNLLDAFEVRVFLPSSVSELRGKTPAMDALFSGFVSVLVATPCTAPAMGTALGATLVMPMWQALMVFLMLGVGLALPLVLIACIPALGNWLPRPGRWMETFRKVMAFPMFATVLWLVWVIGLQTSLEGAMALLGILLALSLLVWAFGHTIQHKHASGGRLSVGQKIGMIICVLLFAGVTVWLLPMLNTQHNATTAHTQDTQNTLWQPWSKSKVDDLIAENKIVFVDFTAAWCMTCQMNKRTTLRQAEVLQAFADNDIVLLEADWTRPNPEIGKELERLKRNGLPVYVFYQQGKEPLILPEILTPSIVLDALKNLK